MKKLRITVLSLVMLFTMLFGGTGAFAAYGEVEVSPRLEVFQVTPEKTQVNAGDEFNVNIVIGSNGNTQLGLYNVRAALASVDTQAGFMPVGTQAYLDIGTLAANDRRTVTYKVKASKNMPTGKYLLEIAFSGTDYQNNSLPECIASCYIDVVNPDGAVKPDGNLEASFILSNASIPEGTGSSNLATNLKIEFKNVTSNAAYETKIQLGGFNDAITLDSFTDTYLVGKVEGNSVAAAEFPIVFAKKPQKSNVLTANITYKDNNGNLIDGGVFNIYLNAKENESSDISDGDAVFTPRVIVSDYEVSTDRILSGDEFTLSFTLKNTSEQLAIKNVTVSVSAMDSGTTSIGAVFTPIEGGTSFYTASIGKGETQEYSINLKTNAAAGAKSYPVTITYSYEYEVDKMVSSGNGTSDINLQVYQPIKLELMQYFPPTECYGYSGAGISFQYYNKGKNPMTNLSISVEGDFQLMSSQQTYVGTLAASSYDEFFDTIIPVSEFVAGDVLNAVLVFTFTDASDNEQRVEYPFSVTMMEEISIDPGDDDKIDWDHVIGWDDNGNPIYDYDTVETDTESEGLAWWVWAIIGGGALIVVIIVIVIIVKVKKSKNNNEDDDDDI